MATYEKCIKCNFVAPLMIKFYKGLANSINKKTKTPKTLSTISSQNETKLTSIGGEL